MDVGAIADGLDVANNLFKTVPESAILDEITVILSIFS